MSFNLLDTVKGLFNNDLISKAASFLGENESGISKALSGIIPVVAGGMLSKASSGTDGATEVLNSAKEAHGSGIFSNPGSLISGNSDILNKGAGLLKGLFGDKSSGITNAISSFAGIKSSSATSLMSMAAPATLSSVGKHASENNMNAGGLMQLLNSQKDAIMSALPAGLSSIAGLLGFGKTGDHLSSVTNSAKNTVNTATEYAEEKAGSCMVVFIGRKKWLQFSYNNK
jgi:hypothetical protein